MRFLRIEILHESKNPLLQINGKPKGINGREVAE